MMLITDIEARDLQPGDVWREDHRDVRCIKVEQSRLSHTIVKVTVADLETGAERAIDLYAVNVRQVRQHAHVTHERNEQ